jgi:O-antigen/teichoic acid export membrane protein
LTLSRLVARGLKWTSLESFALSGLSLISLVVFARLLSAEEFGLAALALAIVQALSIPVDLLFHDAIIQQQDLDERAINSAFTVSVALGVGSCAGCWIFGGVIEQLVGQPGLAGVLRWMSLSLLGTGFGSVLIAVKRRKLEFRALALRSLSGRAGSAVLAIGLAVLGGGIWSLVLQQVLLVCLGTLTLWWLSSDRPRFQFSWAPTAVLLRYGWLSTSQHAVGILIPRVFTMLVGAYLGTKVVGLLSLAFRGLDMLRDLLSVALCQVAMPLFVRLRDDRQTLFSAYARSVKLTALVTFPIFAGLALEAEEVMLVVFGAEWRAATPWFTVVALLTLPYFVRLYAPSLLNALGKPSVPIFVLLAEALYVVGGMLAFGDRSVGLVMGIWASRLLISLPIDVWLLRRTSGMPAWRQLQGALVPAVATAAMACVVLASKNVLQSLSPELRLLPIAAGGAATYVACVFLLDRELIRQFTSFVAQASETRN